MDFKNKILVAGASGLVGSALVRNLKAKGYNQILTPTHKELDLLDQTDVLKYLSSEKPDFTFIAAGKVGGINANNKYRADFLYENLQIQSNLIHGCFKNNLKKLICFGSSCIYPENADQPLKEESLLTGPLQYTNEPYAIAKIAGVKLCESYNLQYGCNYLSVMPTNTYGPNDNYDLENCHVMPALIKKIHDAKVNNNSTIEVWGTGKVRREFIHSYDLADASTFLMEKDYRGNIINIGVGKDLSIRELVFLIKDIVDYQGDFIFNDSMPDGTFQKKLDTSKLNDLGWFEQTKLRDGIKMTYENTFINK